MVSGSTECETIKSENLRPECTWTLHVHHNILYHYLWLLVFIRAMHPICWWVHIHHSKSLNGRCRILTDTFFAADRTYSEHERELNSRVTTTQIPIKCYFYAFNFKNLICSSCDSPTLRTFMENAKANDRKNQLFRHSFFFIISFYRWARSCHLFNVD